MIGKSYFLLQAQGSPDSLFSFVVDVPEDGEEESSARTSTISAEMKPKFERLLLLLQQDTSLLVQDSSAVKAIFKEIQDRLPADIEEVVFQAAFLEGWQLQYGRASRRIADRAAQAGLDAEILKFKRIADDKHEDVKRLEASSTVLE